MLDNLNTRDERAGRGKSTRRQTVLSGRKGSVHADFIEASGLVPTIKASTVDPVIATIANGYNKFGSVDKVIEITADVSYPSIQSNATTFLGVDEDKNPVTSVLPPVYGNIFGSDRENKINASFNGNNGDTEFVDEYGNHFRAYGTGWQISNVNQYQSMNTLRCNGVDNVSSTNRCEVTLANFDDRSLHQWTYEGFFRADSVSTAVYQPIFFTVPGTVTAGMGFKLHPTDGSPHFWLSNNESGYNIWNTQAPTPMNATASRPPLMGLGDIGFAGPNFAPLQAAQWYHFAWVFNGLKHMFFLNGYLIVDTESASNNEVFDYLKPAKANKIYLGAKIDENSQHLTGNISNFAFHPYAKYSTKKVAVAGDTPAVRDIFTPPSVPLSLTTQSDRYYQESEAIYLDFESAADGDITTKDLYGRQLSAVGNNSVTLTTGSYVESGASKFGTKSLYFSGTASAVNGAYIKAPVWADKWTVEFWGRRETTSGAADHKLFGNVVPGVIVGESFGVFLTDNNGANLAIKFRLGSTDSSADIISFDTGFTYSASTYYHFAVSYDGMTYRVFVDGSLLTSTVSQLKIASGSHFLFGRSSGNSQHLNGKIDDFAYVPYCKYTAGFIPPATALLASMPEQYVFDTKKMQMYKGYPTAFVAENTVFVGEALTSATNVEQVITYALNGEYEERFSSDLIFIPGGLLFTRKHNIGAGMLHITIKAVVKAPSGLGALNEVIDIKTYYTSGVTGFDIVSVIDRNLYRIRGGVNQFQVSNLGGAATQVSYSVNEYLIDLLAIAERSF